MPIPQREIPPGSQFNNYKVLYETDRAKNKMRQFFCLCDCGTERVVRLDRLGKTTSCIECRSKYDYLYKQHPDLPRKIQDSHAWECWMNMLLKAKERGTPVGKEFHDFGDFLKFYLSSTGMTLEDVLKGRTGWSYYHAERINKEIGWTLKNTTFIRFVTERARHKPTYQYWDRLRGQGLLDEDLMNYKNFVNAFGTKSGELTLARRDITHPHSKQNSYWIKRNERREV